MMFKSSSRPTDISGLISLDGGLATLASVSAAFLAFAMPTDLFFWLIAETGLPNLVSAAEPPLGVTARLLFIATIAAFTFIAVWALLRALDRVPTPRRRYDPIDISFETPRVRRGDAHPDAPTRRPLLAGYELGEPLALSVDLGEPMEDEPLTLSDPLDPALDETSVSLAADVPVEEEEFEAAPGTTVESEQQDPAVEALSAPLPDAANESVSDLMKRLEGGLARRGQATASGVEILGEKTSFEEKEPVAAPGHRLRGAINNLERLAKGG